MSAITEKTNAYTTTVIPGFTETFQSLSVSHPESKKIDPETTKKVMGIALELECYVNRGFGGTRQTDDPRYSKMIEGIKKLSDEQISFTITGRFKTIPSSNFLG